MKGKELNALGPDDRTIGQRRRKKVADSAAPTREINRKDENRFAVGEVLAQRYKIIRLLGRGGMGVVYQAEDLKLDETIALKFLPLQMRARSGSMRRLISEVKIARRIGHPNVCRVYDIIEADELCFLSMQYLAGEDLAVLLRRIGRITADRSIVFAIQIAEGLSAAHDLGILHRDLKPSNLMLDEHGNLQIMDFGLAAFSGSVQGPDVRSGTPAYMAPEQAAGREVTEKSDLYALGVVLFEMFVGKRPENLESVPNLFKEIDREVQDLVSQCLKKDPSQRPVSARAVADELKRIRARLGESTTALLSKPSGIDAAKPISTNIPGGCWSVPHPRNPFFYGREELLDEVHRLLQETGRVALSGLGGIGKTQVAVEYLYRRRTEFHDIFWIRAETEAQCRDDLTRIVAHLSIPGAGADGDQDDILRLVLDHLSRRRNWLIVFDNADRPEMLRPFMPSQGCFLLTSRAMSFSALGIRRPLTVPALTGEEASSFLLDRICRPTDTEEEITAVAELAEELGFLPLALEQAGAYLETTGASLTDYLKNYRRRPLPLLEKRVPQADDYPHSVARTWAASFEEVEKLSRPAAELLRICAFLAADRIPQQIFEIDSAVLGGALSEHFTDFDDLAIVEVLEPLQRFSLIRRHRLQKTFSVHRLVQLVVRDAEKENEQFWIKKALAILRESWPSMEEIRQNTAVLRLCERLHPHTVFVLNLSTDKYLLETRESALVAADILRSAQQYAWMQGAYDDSSAFSRRALHLCAPHLGNDHPDTVSCKTAVAANHFALGQFQEAVTLYEQTLSIYLRDLGEEHPMTTSNLMNLGNAHLGLGDFEQAEECLSRSLRIRKNVLGEKHYKTTLVQYNLAHLYSSSGNFEDAKALLKPALENLRNELGENHPYVASTLNFLASVLVDLGEYDEVVPLFMEALQILRDHFGGENPETARILNNLGENYFLQGDERDAERYFLEALDFWRSHFASSHVDMAHPLLGLGKIRERNGERQEARRLFKQAATLRRDRLGDKHPLTQEAQDELNRVDKVS